MHILIKESYNNTVIIVSSLYILVNVQLQVHEKNGALTGKSNGSFEIRTS